MGPCVWTWSVLAFNVGTHLCKCPWVLFGFIVLEIGSFRGGFRSSSFLGMHQVTNPRKDSTKAQNQSLQILQRQILKSGLYKHSWPCNLITQMSVKSKHEVWAWLKPPHLWRKKKWIFMAELCNAWRSSRAGRETCAPRFSTALAPGVVGTLLWGGPGRAFYWNLVVLVTDGLGVHTKKKNKPKKPPKKNPKMKRRVAVVVVGLCPGWPAAPRWFQGAKCGSSSSGAEPGPARPLPHPGSAGGAAPGAPRRGTRDSAAPASPLAQLGARPRPPGPSPLSHWAAARGQP